MHKYHIIPAGGGRLAPFTGTLHKGGAGRDSEPRLRWNKARCQRNIYRCSGRYSYTAATRIDSNHRRVHVQHAAVFNTDVQGGIYPDPGNENFRFGARDCFQGRRSYVGNEFSYGPKRSDQNLYSHCINREPEGGAA
nr:MAG TPA: hypothetical protein [Bacteriophage sp.]